MRLAIVNTKSTLVHGYFVIGTEALNEDGEAKSVRKLICKVVKGGEECDDGDCASGEGSVSASEYLEEEEEEGIKETGILKEEAFEGNYILTAICPLTLSVDMVLCYWIGSVQA